MKGMTLWDAMIAIYEKYGYYKDAVKSIGLKGIEGQAKIQAIMDTLRNTHQRSGRIQDSLCQGLQAGYD